MKQLLSILFTLALCWPAFGQTKSIVTPLATTSTDNGLLRYDGTTGQLVQAATGMTYSDNRALTIGGATITASEPILDLSQTWNNGAVTFTGLKYNVTDTASASGSLLMDLQKAGVSMARITKNGDPVFGGGNAFGATTISSAGGNVEINAQSGVRAKWDSLGFYSYLPVYLGGNGDTQLTRDSAATIQMGADAATATAQKLKAHDGSGTDKAGADITIAGGNGTGTAAGGSVYIATTGVGPSTGSSANTSTNRIQVTPSGSTIITSGPQTGSSNPILDMSQTWNNGATTFTALKANVTDTASAAGSLLMQLQNGGTNRFAVSKLGAFTSTHTGGGTVYSDGDGLVVDLTSSSAGQITLRPQQGSFWGVKIGSQSSYWISTDVELKRDAAATLQMGSDAATATAQTLKAHDGNGTDKDGANITFAGGQSTGTGRGGSVITSTSLSSTTGSSANSYSTRTYQNAKPVTLTESAATTIATIAVGSSKYVGARLFVTVNAADATNFQALSSTLNVNAVNKAGTVTSTITQVDGTTAASSGTLTATYTVTTSGNNVIIQCNAVSSLTQTTLAAKWSIETLNSDDTAAVTVP